MSTHIITLSIPQRYFKACQQAVSCDQTRYILNGLNLRADERGLFLAAVDGRKLIALRVGPYEGQSFNVVLKNYIHTSTTKGEILLRLNLDTRIVEFEGGMDPMFRLIDGKFPAWENVIPNSHDSALASYDPELVQSLIKAAAIYRPKDRSVRVHMRGNQAAVVTISNCPDFIAVLMPLKVDESGGNFLNIASTFTQGVKA